LARIDDRGLLADEQMPRAMEHQAALQAAPLSQSLRLDVPGNYTLVDHALARAERGLLDILSVEGPPNPDIYNGQVMSGMGH
jgi:hypothetical protein